MTLLHSSSLSAHFGRFQCQRLFSTHPQLLLQFNCAGRQCLCRTSLARSVTKPIFPRAYARHKLLQLTGYMSLSTTPNYGQPNAANTAPDSISTPSSKPLSNNLRYIDIGINLGDPVFRGKYHGKQAHDDDFPQVLQRALNAGVQKLMITGSNLDESQHAINIAKEYSGLCFATVGVHPCSSDIFNNHKSGSSHVLSTLRDLASSGSSSGYVVAFGEIGLDYDRLMLCSKEVQLKYFEVQLDLAVELQLPLFLHSRAAAYDFERLLKSRLAKLPKGGLVHSFTGTREEMESLVAQGLDIGINGCSLKTEENLEVVKAVPLDRLQIETDGPWCEMRPSHASSKYLSNAPPMPKAVKKEKWSKDFMVKGRNEPCTVGLVAHVIAQIKGISVEEVTQATWRNSINMFGLGEKAIS